MATIASENAKQIRKAMQVHCGMTSRVDVNLNFTVSGDIAASDSNRNVALDTEEWAMRNLADFQGDGFPLDGTRILKDSTVFGSLADGKIGIRSDIGGTMMVTATATQQFAALTVAVTSGTGTITANGVVYQIRRQVIIPVNASSVTMVIASDNPDARVEIKDIAPGMCLEFDNNNIVSVSLDLRSDLSIVGGDLPVSAIEIHAYWPDDIAEAISNINDDVPIWYYAGYNGDYSVERHFYLSEPASQVDGLLTIRGEDAASKLADLPAVNKQRFDYTNRNGARGLYNWFVNAIKKAGIKPSYTQAAPAVDSSAENTARTMLIMGASPREYIQDIMTVGHTGTFWPVFVDAGIPRITWTKPTSKWDIYEEDCGDVTQIVDRNLAKIVSDSDEFGVLNSVSRSNTWTVIEKDIKITAGKQEIRNFTGDALYWDYQVAYKRNNAYKWKTVESVSWIPSKTSVQKTVRRNGKDVKQWFYTPTLSGKKLTIVTNENSLIPASRRPGSTAKITPISVGRIYQGAQMIYPRYGRLFEMSNISGSFVWKGNPKMQPRDVFTFHRLDGTTETCTIEAIMLEHVEGGTRAKITYRQGVA